MNTYLEVLKKYADFSGRSRRREYWLFLLINILIGFVIGFMFGVIGFPDIGTIVSVVYSLAILIPGLALSFRRLHDTGRSAWWLLIAFIPVIGAVVLLVFYALDSQPGDNKYGPNPKGVSGPLSAATPTEV